MNYDLVIRQGATFNLQLIYNDSNNQVIDLTNYTARMQIRKTIDATSTLLELTTENGGITLGGAAGTIDLHMTAAATTAATWTTGVYDIELVHDELGEEIVDILIEGNVTLRLGVTR